MSLERDVIEMQARFDRYMADKEDGSQSAVLVGYYEVLRAMGAGDLNDALVIGALGLRFSMDRALAAKKMYDKGTDGLKHVEDLEAYYESRETMIREAERYLGLWRLLAFVLPELYAGEKLVMSDQEKGTKS